METILSDFQEVTHVHILQIKGRELSRTAHFLPSLNNSHQISISIYSYIAVFFYFNIYSRETVSQ